MMSRFIARVGLLVLPVIALLTAGCSEADLKVRQSTFDA